VVYLSVANVILDPWIYVKFEGLFQQLYGTSCSCMIISCCLVVSALQKEDSTKVEYRVWNPFRSKLAAAVLGGVDKHLDCTPVYLV
jgi:hypothetical protein